MSPPSTPCPAAEVLESLAAGADRPAEERAHVAACAACGRRLAQIRADNAFLAGFAAGGALPVAAGPAGAGAPTIPGYAIVREVHRGGQGVVYEAVQRSTGRRVAVKVMRSGPLATLADRARFDREVEVLGRLNHPNIIAVNDAGEAGGFQYFVMNYVDGYSFDEVIRAASRADAGEPAEGASADEAVVAQSVAGAGPLPRAAALGLFIKVCDAVHAAHLGGVIHRDLKPSNIRVDRGGEPFVVDFGLAKALDAEDDSLMTRTGQFVGSLPWAAPEQVEGRPAQIDLRTDVYALGVLLFQLLTGELPFDVGSNLRRAVDGILHRDAPRPRAVAARRGAPVVDDELDTIVLKCLAKDPARRYHIAGELARDLRRYLDGEAIEAKRDSATYMLRKTLQRYRGLVTAACVGVLVLGAFSVVMAVLYRRAVVLELAAAAQAREIAAALSHSTIERGRLLAAAGSMAAAEPLLWREYRASAPGTPNARRAHWALRELYARSPCVATWRLSRSVPHEPRFGADGRLWCVDSAGVVYAGALDGAAPEVAEMLAPLPAVPVLATTDERLAVRDGARAVVWDLRTGTRLAELSTGGAPITNLALARDGTRVALGADDGTVHLYDVAGGRLVRAWPAHSERVAALGFAPDGGRLFTCGYDLRLCAWDAATGAALAERRLGEPRPRMQVGHLVTSADGARLALVLDWRILLCDPATLETQGVLEGSLGAVQRLAFGPTGRWLASAGADKRIIIWDADSGTSVRRLAGHAGNYTGLGFSPDGALLVSAAADGAVRAWETGIGAAVAPGLAAELDAASTPQDARFAPDGAAVVVASADGTLWAADWRSGEALSTLRGHTDVVFSLAFAPGGDVLASCGNDGTVRLWDWPGAALRQTIDVHTLLGHTEPVGHESHPGPQCVAWAPDGGELAVGLVDGVVVRWDVAGGRIRQVLRAHTARVTAVVYAPDGRRLYTTGMDGALATWDAATGGEVRRVAAHAGGARTLDVSRDGRRLASGGNDATVRLWDAAGGAALGACTGHQQDVFVVRFSPDGAVLVSGERGQVEAGVSAIIVWDVATASELARLGQHADMVFGLDFEPDGRHLVSCSRDQRVLVHDLAYFDRHIAGSAAAFGERGSD